MNPVWRSTQRPIGHVVSLRWLVCTYLRSLTKSRLPLLRAFQIRIHAPNSSGSNMFDPGDPTLLGHPDREARLMALFVTRVRAGDFDFESVLDRLHGVGCVDPGGCAGHRVFLAILCRGCLSARSPVGKA